MSKSRAFDNWKDDPNGDSVESCRVSKQLMIFSDFQIGVGDSHGGETTLDDSRPGCGSFQADRTSIAGFLTSPGRACETQQGQKPRKNGESSSGEDSLFGLVVDFVFVPVVFCAIGIGTDVVRFQPFASAVIKSAADIFEQFSAEYTVHQRVSW
jgi:hypothetical protein